MKKKTIITLSIVIVLVILLAVGLQPVERKLIPLDDGRMVYDAEDIILNRFVWSGGIYAGKMVKAEAGGAVCYKEKNDINNGMYSITQKNRGIEYDYDIAEPIKSGRTIFVSEGSRGKVKEYENTGIITVQFKDTLCYMMYNSLVSG